MSDMIAKGSVALVALNRLLMRIGLLALTTSVMRFQYSEFQASPFRPVLIAL